MKKIVCRKYLNRVSCLFSALLLSFFCLTVTSVSATENIEPSVESLVEQFNSLQPQYVTEYRDYNISDYVVSPATIHHTQMIGGLRYSGTLTRHTYVSTGERWLVTYKGYITAD